MHGRWVLGGLIGLAASACGGPASLELGVPEDLSAYGTVIRVHNFGTRYEALVGRGADLDSLVLEPQDGEDAALVGLMLYEPALESFGLEAGPMTGSLAGHMTPDGAFVSTDVDGESDVIWSELDARSLREFMVPYQIEAGCKNYGVKPINIPQSPDTMSWEAAIVAGAARIDDLSAVMSMLDGRFFRVQKTSSEGSVRVTPLATGGDAVAYAGGFRSPSALWFGGTEGVLASIDLEEAASSEMVYLKLRGKLEGTVKELEKALISIDGDPEREDDIFALTVDGSVLHYDGSRLKPLGAISGTATTAFTSYEDRQIQWVGPGQAIAISPLQDGGSAILRFELDKEPSAVAVPGEGQGSYTALSVGRQGLFVARRTSRRSSGRGEVWLLPHGSDDWVLYARTSFAPLAVLPRAYDLTIAGSVGYDGRLVHLVEGTDFESTEIPECEAVPATAGLYDFLKMDERSSIVLSGPNWGGSGINNQSLWIR